MNLLNSRQLSAAIKALAAIFIVFLTEMAAGAQALSVMPVNIFFSPGQRATSLTVTNQGSRESAIQIRAYAWDQKDGEDQLTTSSAVVLSPPLASIPPGATQVVRLILRQPPEGQEATYRILVDQIPPPAEEGMVHVVLRLSIPIFAKPTIRAFPDLQFHLERDAGQIYLVGTNKGLVHEVLRDILLSTTDGHQFKAESSAPPYILSGATRRWHVATPNAEPLPGETLLLTAHSDAGAIKEQVRFVPRP
jgi:fimbrial chaperone protein